MSAPRRLSDAHVRSLAADLSERDLAIIETVRKLRMVRATQLERLHFAGLTESSRARRRRDVLSRLSRLQLLQTLERKIGGVRAGSAGHIYTLGLAGQRLHRIQSAETKRVRRSAEPSLMFLDHTLAVAEFYTEVHESGLDVLTAEAEPDCWRYFFDGTTRDVLKPDLFISVANETHIFDWFVEIDLGTERRPALKRKMERYEAAYRFGLDGAADESFPRVLWTVGTLERARTLASIIGASERAPGLSRIESRAGLSDIRETMASGIENPNTSGGNRAGKPPNHNQRGAFPTG